MADQLILNLIKFEVSIAKKEKLIIEDKKTIKLEILLGICSQKFPSAIAINHIQTFI